MAGHAGVSDISHVRVRSPRAYLKPRGTVLQSEPTGTAAAVHGPSLEPSLRRYDGGTHGQGFFKEGGTKGGRGSREGGEDRGGSGWGAQPRSSHLVSVEEERIGENSTLKEPFTHIC